MSDAPKKRPWFQFHLSTAVIMMFVASGLLWANLRESVEFVSWARRDFLHGWPFIAHYTRMTLDSEEAVLMYNAGDICGWRWPGVVLNIACALGLVVVVAVVCEWPIRRKERRQ